MARAIAQHGPAGSSASGVVVVPDGAGYWAGAATLTIVMMSVVAVRVHEFFPGASLLRPVLSVTIVGFALLLSHTSAPVKHAALAYPQSKRVIAYLLFAALTAPFALYPGWAINTAKGLLPGVLLLIAFALLPPRRDVLDRMQLWFVGLVLFFSTYTQVVGGSWNGRLRGVGGSFDSNDMASIMAISFPMAAGLIARSAPGRARLIAVGATVALVVGVIATGSRGGTLALLAGAIVFALGLRGERGMTVILAMIVGGVIAWSTAPASFRERMVSITNLENDYNYTHETGRKAVWKRGRQYWRDNFIIGLGAGNFPMAEGASWQDQGDTGKWSTAHNAYVQVFAELGTIGGAIFIAILLGAAKGALPFWRAGSPKQQRAPPMPRPEFLASLVAFAAGAYFLSHAYFMPVYAVFGIIVLADRVRTVESLQQAIAIPGGARPLLVRRPGERGGAAALVLEAPGAVYRGGALRRRSI